MMLRTLLPCCAAAASLSLVACSPDVPQLDLEGLADVFGVPNDIGLNEPPDAGMQEDAAAADVAAPSDAGAGDASTADAVEDVDDPPQTCSWRLVDTLNNPIEGSSYFGLAMTVADDDLVVSSAGVNAAGRAFVFAQDAGAWTLSDTLIPDGDAPQTLFGFSMAYEAGTLVVGAPLGPNGAVHVFTRDGGPFTEVVRVSVDNAEGLGTSVATDGDMIIAGAPRTSNENGAFYEFSVGGPVTPWVSGVGREGLGVAAAYVSETYIVSSEQRVAEVVMEDAPVLANFPEEGGEAVGGLGAALAAGFGSVFVGAPGASLAQGAGSVFVYERLDSGYAVSQRVQAADGASLDGFGTDIAVGRDLLAVGSSATYGTEGAQRGYIFTPNASGEWAEQAVLTAPDGATESGFSGAVAVLGDTVFFADALANDSAGAVYAYRCVVDAQ